jgi:hypothetical protein
MYCWGSCMCSHLPNIISSVYMHSVAEKSNSSTYINSVGICKQIIILIFYQVSSKLVTFLNSFLPLYKAVGFLF